MSKSLGITLEEIAFAYLMLCRALERRGGKAMPENDIVPDVAEAARDQSD